MDLFGFDLPTVGFARKRRIRLCWTLVRLDALQDKGPGMVSGPSYLGEAGSPCRNFNGIP